MGDGTRTGTRTVYGTDPCLNLGREWYLNQSDFLWEILENWGNMSGSEPTGSNQGGAGPQPQPQPV